MCSYPSKFGPDLRYDDLYDGPSGPSDSALSVADDPLALLFYFLSPKLWTQIAVESNPYHTQSIPLRARAIRSQQRRSGADMEDLGEIRRRLVSAVDIEAWEVLRVVALLIARMLASIRKGIAAHWSTKKMGALPTNHFGLFVAKNRFFDIMGYLHFSNNTSHGPRVENPACGRCSATNICSWLQGSPSHQFRRSDVAVAVPLQSNADIQQGQAPQMGHQGVCCCVCEDCILHEVRTPVLRSWQA
ncbi:hypothetical protein PC128_g21778 [Phytophthora cactorum]|nr:hypothetical protein PC120_g20225 [Phytophthora cactorum]KAG3156839.1 hypothetical protein PC128_g21778 [Phytophthora cactorum]KAG4043829.1 hypothetical protein PC123_g20713 [Phytophthora cactorum]